MLRQPGAAGARDHESKGFRRGTPMRTISTWNAHNSSLRPAAARRGSFLTGCLIVLAVLVIIAVIAGLWVRANYRGVLANAGVKMVDAALDKSELDEEQKSAIRAEVETLAVDYKEKRISNEQMLEVMQAIANSPLLPLGAVYAVDKGYVQPSEMTAEEKADARVQLQRVARGFYEEKISQNQLEDILQPISKRQSADADPGEFDVELQEPEDVSVEELRQFVERARAAADEAAIPDEAYQIDIAAELRKAIDKALGREPAGASAPALEQPADPAAPGETPAAPEPEPAPAGGG